MKLIENWKKAHSMLSVQTTVVLSVLAEAWLQLDGAVQAQVLEFIGIDQKHLIAVAAILIIAARLVKQEKVSAP